EGSLPKSQAEISEGDLSLQGPVVEVGLEMAPSRFEGAGMNIHVPKVKVPSVDFSKVTIQASSVDADVSLPKVEASLPETNLKADSVSIQDPDIKVSSAEGSLDLQVPKKDIKVESLEVEVSQPSTEADLPSATVTAAGDISIVKPDGTGGKVEKPSLTMPKADIKAPKVDISLPSVDVTLPKASIDLQAPEVEISMEGESKAPEKEATKTKDGKFKMPKFGMPSFGWSSSREAKGAAAADVDVSLKETQVTVPSATAEVDVTLHKAEIQAPSMEVTVEVPPGRECEKGQFKMPDIEMPKVTSPHSDVSLPEENPAVLSGSVLSQHHPDKKVSGGSINTKFRIPSLGFSKIDISSSKMEHDSPLPEGNITLTKYQINPAESESKISLMAQKSGKGRNKKSQFTMPKLSLPKMKGQKAQVSLLTGETDICSPKQEKEIVSIQKPEKESSGEGTGMGIEVPKVTIPTLEFSKPEVKAPKIEMPTSEVKGPDMSVERTSGEIAVGDAQIKIEGSEGKTKGPKFQIPQLGFTHSKGKGSEKEVLEVKVPQLKATVEIADIAVEAPNLEVECGTGTETFSPKVQITKTDSKAASESDAPLPSTDISIPHPDSDIQDLDATLKIKGEIKQDGDGEEKEGHFKMPKFKLPSFNWSPKKEASVKSDSGANLEDHKLAEVSGRTEKDARESGADDSGTGSALHQEIPAGKVEQKSPVKKPQFVMPKISLSKIRVPKAQTHSPKAEVDAPVPKMERQGDNSVQIPDIEKSHSKRAEEGSQISIKLAAIQIPTLEQSKIETGASQTDVGVSTAKTDAAVPHLEGSSEKFVLKTSSTDEDTIQKTGIKCPKGEASTEPRSPEVVTEMSVVDGRKMTLEAPEGKIKMPTLQKPKSGITIRKGKGPETEISSTKLEAELPHLKMATEIADISPVSLPHTVAETTTGKEGIPKLEDSVKSFDVSLTTMEADITDSRVNIPKTETYADVVKRGADGQKMQTKPCLSASEDDKDNSLTNSMEVSTRRTVETVDKSQDGPEVYIKIPKLKIPRFTFTVLPTEADVSVSKVVIDPKGSSTDTKV
ncbi:AHNK protein, partial [Turnix velox]|nr:AHNK protein [Turnix velox]